MVVWRRRRSWIGLVTMVVAVALAGPGLPAGAETGEIVGAGSPDAVAGSYLVVLKDSGLGRSAVSAKADTLAARAGGRVGHRYERAFRGFEVTATEAEARKLAADPAVAAVHQNRTGRITDSQQPVSSWGLDRIDQRTLPLDNTFRYPSRPSRVTVYIVDSGMRLDHVTFDGRAVSGIDTVDNDSDASDCHGHGTFVGGVAGGSENWVLVDGDFGVAKGARLVSVRVAGCGGFTSAADTVAGLEWILNDHDPGEVAVVNMSLVFPPGSLLVDQAVERLLAESVTVVAAAGNNGIDQCSSSSPARVPGVITVGATDITDKRWHYSNYGPCVDIFAPGVNVTSADHRDPNKATTGNGTSFATPHVAGAAALVLDAHPEYDPRDVAAHLFANASAVVRNPGANTNDWLLFVTQEPQANRFRIRTDPTATSTAPGGQVNVTVRTEVTWGVSRPVSLSAIGVPAGVSVVFTPPTVNAGASATMTITVDPEAPLGVGFPILVSGTGPNTASAPVNLTITSGTRGCTGTAPGRVPIPGHGATTSDIVFTGCDRAPSARSEIVVSVIHGCRPALDVHLIAPDGTRYLLKEHESFGKCKDNWAIRRKINLSRETTANGTWRIEVYDTCSNCGSGRINPWRLTL